MAKIRKQKPKKGLWMNLAALAAILAFILFFKMDKPVDISKLVQLSDSGQWISLQPNQRSTPYTFVDGNIFAGEIGCGDHYMKGVDLPSFEVFGGSSYARDKNKIFFPRQITCICGAECSACYPEKYMLESADRSTFVVASNDNSFGIDKKYIYKEGIVLDSFCNSIK